MKNWIEPQPLLANEQPVWRLPTLIKATLIFAATFMIYFWSRSPGLDEFDSVNFAMGVRSFNLWKHQPHPPGYPLFIFAGWISSKLFRLDPEISLYLVSAFGGALFIVAWFFIVRRQFNERLAWGIAGCLTITPIVWMTATKVLTDTLAAGFLSAEICAAIFLSQRPSLSSLLSVSLFGAAAAGARPQLILVTIVILIIALKRARVNWKMSTLGASVFVLGCLAWLCPTWYSQWRLQSDVPAWLTYPKLLYGQWQWRFDRPHIYIGAGDWSPRYLGLRLAEHFLGWFGVGFGFLKSPLALFVGAAMLLLGIRGYGLHRGPEDNQFWRFHVPWALLHIVTIFLFLGGKQRYYLVIFPLLLVVLLRGALQLGPRWRWAALLLPALFLYISIPLAIENHRDEAPPLRLVRYLERRYPPAERPTVILLFTNAGRHSEWYTPEFRTFRDIPPPNTLLNLAQSATAIYTDNPNVPLPAGWRRVQVATFERSFLIHSKHDSLTLFSIERDS